MGSATLTNPLGTTVQAANPTKNYNVLQGLALRTGGAGNIYGLLYFGLPFALGANVQSAKIKFYTLAMTTGTHTFTFKRLSSKFDPSRVTWNTRPTLAGYSKAVVKTGVLADKVEWEVDITDLMQTVSGGGYWWGLQIESTETTARTIYSDQHVLTDYRPRFEVTWSDAPGTPTDLAPAGNRAVGVTRPVVRATFLDVSGDTSLAALQVQADPAANFTTPAFDSGTVPATVPELDLATTAFTALTENGSTWWRIRLQDGAGAWSGYSLPAQFKYLSKPVLTVDSPPVGTPKVEDSSPLIAWTVTNKTQAHYQVWVQHIENGILVTDWTSTKITTAVDDVIVPPGKITDPNTVYTLTVRVWDGNLREQTPGVPLYAEVVRTFTFIPGSATGTTNLTATPDALVPKVVLAWKRTTAPDGGFNVLRDGKVIASRLSTEPVAEGGTFVSGTDYTWTDHTASPGRSLVYTVQAVVNNVASATNPSVTVPKLTTWGIWLREPSVGLELMISDKEQRSFILGEQTGIFRSIAPDDAPMAVNQSQSGLEGKISGSLEFVGGKTPQQWRNIYLKLRKLRVRRLLVTVGDYTFWAVCSGFELEFKATPRPRFAIGFNFHQQDSIDSMLVP